MSLFKFIDSFKSVVSLGRREAVNKLLESPENIISNVELESLLTGSPEPTIDLPEELTSIPAYNSAITSVYTDLHSLYKESDNLWTILGKIDSLGKQDSKRLALSVDELETKVNQSKAKAITSKISFTDTIVETFNSQTPVEQDKVYYQSGSIANAFIDVRDGLLKLPVDGEFLNQLSKPGIVPSNVYLDRIIGLPVEESHTVNNAFDGTITNFWNETIHSSSPIYATTDQFPWLPVVDNDTEDVPRGYKGGAACRVKVEFENTTQISELDIRPYGQHNMNLLAVGWTNLTSNLIPDPNFTFGIASAPNSYWYKDTTMFGLGDTGDAVYYGGAGPNGEAAVKLFTNVSSGSVFLIHGQFDVPVSQGLEFSFLAKTIGNTPIVVISNYIASGGVPLQEKRETIHLDSLGWTSVVLTVDPVPGTKSIQVKVGIPPFFERKSELWICNPFIEQIKEYVTYEKITGRKTVFLKHSVDARRVYLIFSQENYTFKSYSVSNTEEDRKVRWDRLTRRINTSPQLLDWDREINRAEGLRVPRTHVTSLQDSYIRNVEGTSWELLNDIERYAYKSINDISKPVYEYQMGAFEIYIRHREYAPSARYVSLPIRVNGEIREVRLEAIDSVMKNLTSAGSIKYTITLTENDTPERGKFLLNSKAFFSDNDNYPAPPSTISYLDYTTWSYASSAWQAIYWPYAASLQETSDILLIQASPEMTPGMFIQKNLDNAIDLRGATSITGEFYLFSPREQRNTVDFKFSVSFSPDGSTWEVAQILSGKFSSQYNIDTGTGKLIFIPFNINMTNFSPAGKRDIQYIRITSLTPTFYSSTNWILLRRLKTEGWNSGGRTLKFFPADDITSVLQAGTDFIVPVKSIVEEVDGTDRYGRIFLKDYPYLNRTKISSLTWAGTGTNSISSNLQGRRINYDPNALWPKYLNSTGGLRTLEGYRPIRVTLRFPQNNLLCRPDILGKPKKNDFIYLVDEVLSSVLITDTSTSKTSFGGLSKNNDSSTENWKLVEPNTQETSTARTLQAWQTKYKNIIQGEKGSSVVAKWSSGGVHDVVIDPIKLIVNASLGVVRVTQTPPSSGFTQVKLTYYTEVTEESPRENFFDQSIVSGLDSVSRSKVYPQVYPVTRNMTNYITGIIPKLRKPDLDPLNSTYYPVFEYYVHPDGYLVFADNYHKYSDMPVVATVEYETLGIVPRIAIDLTRPNTTNKTPFVDSFKLLLNVRRN